MHIDESDLYFEEIYNEYNQNIRREMVHVDEEGQEVVRMDFDGMIRNLDEVDNEWGID